MIDRLFEPYLGDGFNPPGIQYIIFTIISFMMFRSLFLFLEYHKDLKICSGAVKLFSLIGRNSLYVFMYHLTVECLGLSAFGIYADAANTSIGSFGDWFNQIQYQSGVWRRYLGHY